MTGNEHFIAASKALEKLHGCVLSTSDAIALAQVHATLALVFAVNRMQTDANAVQRYMAETILEREEAGP